VVLFKKFKRSELVLCGALDTGVAKQTVSYHVGLALASGQTSLLAVCILHNAPALDIRLYAAVPVTHRLFSTIFMPAL